VRARVTPTFIGLKQGLFTGDAPDYVGEVEFSSLGAPGWVYERVSPSARRIDGAAVLEWLPRRPRTAHKGRYGHVLVVGGDLGMGGAARMAAEAAGRVGAGLVSLATRAEHVSAVIAARPEIMCRGAGGAADIEALLERATVVVLGPGLGRDSWGRELFQRCLRWQGPMVVDADALNLLAETPASRDDWVLTPHPGEAGRLLGIGTADVQADRFAALEELRRRYHGAPVLKGAGTLTAGASEPWLCDAGNPGMASGGMGDVLSGVIAGLMAQGLTPESAAAAGVWLHAGAADQCARTAGERGMLATDLLPYLQRLANPQ
jgi:NAD(P)H-hydrate epimerase